MLLLWCCAALHAQEVGRAPLEADALTPLVGELADGMADATRGRRAGGVGLAVLVDGEVRWQDTAGWADRGQQQPFKPETPFPVGELTRLYTAAIALRLAAQGVVDLDAPIDQYLPDFTLDSRFAGTRPPTLRQLLAHQSGLPWSWLRGTWYPRDAPAEALDRRAFALVQPPGRLTIISNLGYVALAEALSAASGQDYATLLAREIVDPLGLEHTGLTQPSDLAKAHRDGKIEAAWLARDAGAQGVIASLADLARFTAALMPDPGAADAWLKRAQRQHMTRAQNADLALDLGNAQGLGWSLNTSVRPAVGRIASLVGVAPGFRAEVRIALDHGIAVVAVANSDDTREAMFDLSAKALDQLLELRAGAPPRDPKRPLPERVPKPPGAQVSQFAARYVTPGGLIEIEPRGEAFRLTAAGLRFRVEARGDDWFGVRYDLLGLLPIGFDRLNRVALAPLRIGEVEALVAFSADRWFLLGTAYTPSPANGDLAGVYRITNPDRLIEDAEIDQVRLELVDGTLVARYLIPFVIDIEPTIPLVALGPDRLITAGIGANQGEALRFDTGGAQPTFIYSGYRFERVPER